MFEQIKRNPLYVDGMLLIALLGIMWQMATWKAQVDEWRSLTSQQVTALTTQQITPGAAREIAVLSARVEASDRAHETLKSDIVRRLDRQDQKLDMIAERLNRTP